MSSWWRQAMLYLGLGPDEEYEDHDTHGVPGGPETAPGELGRQPVGGQPRSPVHSVGSALEPDPEPEPALTAVRPIRDTGTEPAPAPQVSVPMAEGSVRTMAVSSAKPHVVLPSNFNQAQEIGDRFKNRQPVIVNLQAADRDLARRIIDFASGLCYGIGGQMERVAKDVYLLTPADVEVSDEERRRLTERGLHDA